MTPTKPLSSNLTAPVAARIAQAWDCVAKASAWAEADCDECQFVVNTLVASARWEQQHLLGQGAAA